MPAAEVVLYDLVGNRKKRSGRVFSAFRVDLSVRAQRTFVKDGGSVARPAELRVLPESRIYVFASAEERSKEGDFLRDAACDFWLAIGHFRNLRATARQVQRYSGRRRARCRSPDCAHASPGAIEDSVREWMNYASVETLVDGSLSHGINGGGYRLHRGPDAIH